MSQSSFVLEKDLQFIDVGFLAKVGDVFVFTPPQTMVVYRNGDIQINMAMTQAAIDGLLMKPNKLVLGRSVWTALRRHPKVVAAIKDQAGRYLHTCSMVTMYEPYV